MLADCLDHPTPFSRSAFGERKTGRQYVNFSMLRKKRHSIVVELPMLKDNFRRIGGGETLLYFSGRRKIPSVHLNNILKLDATLRTVFHAMHSFNEY